MNHVIFSLFDWGIGNLEDNEMVCNNLEEVRTNIDRIDNEIIKNEIIYV